MKTYLPFAIAALFVTLTSAIAEPPAPKRQPVGIPKDAKLFNGKWYLVYLDKCGWKTARDKCARQGGQLAVIPDEPTQAFIRGINKGLHLWIGATDEKVEGLWVWVDGTEMKFTAWNRGQPDNYRGPESYLHTWPNGAWGDAREKTEGSVGYICEWNDK